MSQLEPYLPDERVLRVQDKLYLENPVMVLHNTNLVTTRIEPPWYGLLPDGRTATTNHPVVQFVAVSDHPRPLQRKHGYRHATVATVWQQAFEDAEKDKTHYVSGDQAPPEEVIFRGVVAKHLEELDSLSSIMN